MQWTDDQGNVFERPAITVNRSVWNGTESQPKTRRSRAPVPVVPLLADALEAHRLRAGILAQPCMPIFQGATGKPLILDNLANRVIAPVSNWHGMHSAAALGQTFTISAWMTRRFRESCAIPTLA